MTTFLSEQNLPISLEHIDQRLSLTGFWVFNSKTLAMEIFEATHLEEYIGPTIIIKCGDEEIEVPASWHLLGAETESWRVDLLPVVTTIVYETPGISYVADTNRVITQNCRANSLQEEGAVIYPVLPRHLAHVIYSGKETRHGRSYDCGVVMAASDFSKNLANEITIGDVSGYSGV